MKLPIETHLTTPDMIVTSARSTTPEAARLSHTTHSFVDGAWLRGTPASVGCATGRARIVRTPRDADRVSAGDILVCAQMTPALSPLLAVVAGVVTETGGALSSGAIVAREYGIPAVFAVAGATTLIRDGQVVTLDGHAGLVQLQSSAP